MKRRGKAVLRAWAFVPLLSILVLVLIAGSSSGVGSQPGLVLAGPLPGGLAAGPVDAPIAITGAGFPASTTIGLYWYGYMAENYELGEYLISSVRTDRDGNFSTSITTPRDFGVNVPHTISAKAGETVLAKADYAIVPSLELASQPTDYSQGDDVILLVHGAPLTGVPAPDHPEEGPVVLKLTYDNQYWGMISSHISPVPVATHPDTGGEAAIRFIATGGSGTVHVIRAYEGSMMTVGPWLGCEIGGEVQFRVFTY